MTESTYKEELGQEKVSITTAELNLKAAKLRYKNLSKAEKRTSAGRRLSNEIDKLRIERRDEAKDYSLLTFRTFDDEESLKKEIVKAAKKIVIDYSKDGESRVKKKGNIHATHKQKQ